MGSRSTRVPINNVYPLPLYLNQKYVFDLLAMMEAGFSQMETVKTTQTEQEDATRRLVGDVGVKNVFALFGITLGGERASKMQAGGAHEVTTERVYTPNALFARMRQWLHEDELIVRSRFASVVPGEFVETQVVLRKNGLIESFQSFLSLIQMAQVFENPQQTQGLAQSQSKSRSRVPAGANSVGEHDLLTRQIQGLLEQLNGQGTLDLVGSVADEGAMQVVLTLDRAFLGDPSLSDLVDGQYTVLGKVVRVLRADSADTINLLRKSSVGKIQFDVFQKITSELSKIKDVGVALPDLALEVEPPVIQIVPIAIFA